METIYYLILVPMVYLSFFIFIAGIIAQVILVLRRPRLQTTLQIYPEKKPSIVWALLDTFMVPGARRNKPVLWVFLLVFHVCLLLLLIGHLELVWDLKVFQFIPHEVFLGNGFVGIILLVAIVFFLFRRFVSPTKELSVPEDYFILILLFLVVIFGSEMDWARRWYVYEEMGKAEYREYLYSLLTLSPDIASVSEPGHSFMLVLHVFFANLLIMIFPFSNLGHSIFSIATNKLRRG